MRFLSKPRSIAIVTSVLSLSLLAVGDAGAARIPNCTPATNVELIIDDSGSMAGFDSERLRVEAVKILLNAPENGKKTLGAVDFGSTATTVFPPGLIATQKAAMATALDAAITADGGSTNYNDAFARAKQDNPNANARIFLTDGGHNEGDYANGHQGGPPTFVVGFGSSTAGEDGARLQQIANETAGKYYPQTDSSTLQSTMNEINAALDCQTTPVAFKDIFSKVGQVKQNAITVPRGTSSINVVLSWASSQSQFTLVAARPGANAAQVSRRKRKRVRVKLKRVNGKTFQSVRITGIKRGKLKLRLKAKKLGFLPNANTLTTQVTLSRRR